MKSTQLLFLLFISVAAWAGGPAKSNFTAMEVNHIRVKTPGLFNGRKSFSIHLDSIKENEYCFPLPGGKVISAYGARRGHSGTDIKTKANDTIRCAFDGIVRMAKTYAAYGNVVVVRHDNGLESIYSHNSRNLVKSGDIVKAGDAVGLTGRTGRAQGRAAMGLCSHGRREAEPLPSRLCRTAALRCRSFLFLFRNHCQEWGLFSLSFHDVPFAAHGVERAVPRALTRVRAIFALCFAFPFATFFHPRTGDKLCLEACQAWQTRKPGTKTK